MRSWKRLLACVLAVTMVGGLFAACSDAGDGDSDGGGNQEKLKIGVIQYMEHDALDAAYAGFKDALKEAGYSEEDGTVEFEFENAQDDQATCNTIATKLASADCDLILAIATPAAVAVANVIKDVPILVTAVTDLVDAGLVDSNESPGGNVSGTSDINPVSDQMDLLLELIPDAENVGLLYTSSESNSEFQVKLAAEVLDEKGIASEEYTISQVDEVESKINSMKGSVDALYIPTDNKLADAMPQVSAVANAAGIPVITGESGMVKNGGLATYGLDYYLLGKQTAEMAVRIFNGEDVSTMPVETQPLEDCETAINTETADALGLTLPQDILDDASVVKYPAVG
ncbi:MAG: ABC transporter substrate-binding protein [Clostridiales bacterium]|nr:ABC transporter substrate-binding protein [Clostridiales bacterium]